MFDISSIIFELSNFDLDEKLEIKSTKENLKIKDFRVNLQDLPQKINISRFFQKVIDNLSIYLVALNSYNIFSYSLIYQIALTVVLCLIFWWKICRVLVCTI